MSFLKYPPFVANVTLVQIANGQGTLKRGSSGDAVKLIQKALIELGFAMAAGADGSFGGQTHTAVTQIQSKWGIAIDGIVGQDTIGVLDVDICILHGIITPAPPPPAGLQTVRFWINAFIPDPSLSTDVKPAPGASAGNSMITIPWPVPPNFKRCFLGDHRGYSNDSTASARIHMAVNFAGLDTPNPTMQSGPEDIKCGKSTEIDPASGVVIGEDTAPKSRCSFSNFRTAPAPAGNPNGSLVQVDCLAAANLPLLTGSPDIDFTGTFQIDRARKYVRFVGSVDGFPCFEGWVSFNGGEPQNMFKMAPISPIFIVGSSNRPVDGIVRWR
ncbi:hypothetical protein GQ44DRAFT_775212 [Phaeosphaeriaceae sp. PMI808]|nr:hypothetical protein GQ44DRAFT_775212 [Phaeosphaeriaceae sp. PMI808]